MNLPFTHTGWLLERRFAAQPAGRNRQNSHKQANFSRANKGKAIIQRPTRGAEWGLRTLRQACYQEIPGSAMCVQNLDDSRGLAIRITYRISLRSSSLWEPRHPLLKVVMIFLTWGSVVRPTHHPFRYWYHC